ncbi:MAG: 50S ribosomal protein L10 [Thermoguttaceae bacterium]|nr:50S ribosomal protein L10 [Thermoguttaceae bacterium]MDW8038878.1 50S ribosomal protein L10 [Thermoguttaceae bacterium]
MSKYVKDLITKELRRRLAGVDAAVLVNVSRMDGVTSTKLRKELRQKNISLMVVKNSLARRALMGTPLAPMFEGLSGPAAICWGGEDIVSLAKEVFRLAEQKEYEKLELRGGCMEGKRLSLEELKEVSKMPTRQELLARLVSQILGPGARLAAQLLGPASTLAAQLRQKAEPESQTSSEG